MSVNSAVEADRRPAGSAGSGDDQLRRGLHAMWSGVAPAWAANAGFVDARGRHVTERMLELSLPRPGERVLELACGTGGPGLAAAPLVAPDGDVVLSDVAAEMTAIASERAGAQGLGNVTSRVLDLEHIDEPDRSYDVVLCREGLMLVPDPVRAAAEIQRIMRPGGRAVITVWGPRARNPWLGVVFDAASDQLGAMLPPPGVPHPFSLGDAGLLARVLSDGGLSGVTVGALDTPYHAASVSDWWKRTAALAGPLANKLAALPEPAAQALRARAGKAIGVYETPAGLEIPGLSLVARATRG